MGRLHPTYLGWVGGGRQQSEPGPGYSLIELAAGQIRRLREGQEGLGVKGGPGPAPALVFQGGQSRERTGGLQPHVLWGTEEKSEPVAVGRAGHELCRPCFPHMLAPSAADSDAAPRGSPCARSDACCPVEIGHPGQEPGAAVPDWGSPEWSAAEAGGVSACADTAWARKGSVHVSQRGTPLAGSCFPGPWPCQPSPAQTPVLLTCWPAPPAPWWPTGTGGGPAGVPIPAARTGRSPGPGRKTESRASDKRSPAGEWRRGGRGRALAFWSLRPPTAGGEHPGAGEKRKRWKKQG